MRLGAYLKQNILEPLGMSSTAFKITPDMRARLAKVHARSAEGKLTVTAFEVPQDPEFEPGGGGLSGARHPSYGTWRQTLAFELKKSAAVLKVAAPK